MPRTHKMHRNRKLIKIVYAAMSQSCYFFLTPVLTILPRLKLLLLNFAGQLENQKSAAATNCRYWQHL